MKYYLTYMSEKGKRIRINLSKLPFFDKKNSGKIMNIIDFYNMFDTPEDLLDYLYSRGVVDVDATPNFKIVIKRKNKQGKEYYQEIPHSDIPLVSCTREYFNQDVLRGVIERKLNDDDFITTLRKEFGFLKDYQEDTTLYRYLTYIRNYNSESHEYELDAQEEYGRCVRKVFKLLFSSPKTFAMSAMFTIDYVTPKVLKVPFRRHYLEENDYEEFLEVNDFVKYNPGLVGKALEDALEEEEAFREQEWEREKKNMGIE